jgi:hypothetical protein
MVIAGLLVIAGACLALGLVTQSAVWLIASLIATAGAGFLLFKLRHVIATPAIPAATGSSGSPTDSAAIDTTPASLAAPTGSEPARQPSAAQRGPDDVWVIDGRPRYHLDGCAIIKGQDAEPIPFKQATEDGFMPCSLCEPQAARTR